MLSSTHAEGQRGFTLIELMVAVSIGLFILAGIALVYAEFVKSNAIMIKSAHLQQTLWSLMAVITNDVRRAGYWSHAELAMDGITANRFAPVHTVAGACILYSYDEQKDDADGRPDPEDQHGFRLSDGRIQIKTSDETCGPATCSDCGSGAWWSLTDPRDIQITALAFTADEHAYPIDGGERAIVARKIEIELEGALAGDPAMRHKLRTSVGIRNDEIR